MTVKFKPTREQRKMVEAMAGYGVPHDDIAIVVECDPKTLRKHFRAELDTGHIKAGAKVAESLFKKATGDGSSSVTAAIWWTKARMGWKEQQDVKLSGDEDNPPIFEIRFVGVDRDS